jgi:small subunit ribosomal protein S20
MPNTKSAKKAERQTIKRRTHNLIKKKGLRETLKNYKKLITEGKKDEAKKELPKVYKTLDKMAKSNIIKSGKADRLKSRLSKKVVL